MSSSCNIEFKQPSDFVHIDDEANTELKQMKRISRSHDKRSLEQLIDKCESSNVSLLYQELTDSDMSIVSHSAIIKKKCTELKLGYNNITSAGVQILVDVLDDNTTLEKLNLFNNQIADEGVRCLTDILSLKASKLKMLFIGQNQITDQGVEYLSEILKTNQTLTHLGLSNNEISDQGVISLANVLTNENTTLKELYLWGNKQIGDHCIDNLADMLVYNRTLNKLVLFDCDLSEMSKHRLREIITPRKDFGLFL